MKQIVDFITRHKRLKYYVKNIIGQGIIRNIYNTNNSKRCLIMYVTYPFRREIEDSGHQANWQVKYIAYAISNRGYNIDIIDYDNTTARLRGTYDLIIDIFPTNNNVFRKYMSGRCKTIAYLTGSNPSFQNFAEQRRIEELKNRRGIKVLPRRQVPLLSKEIESYTACFMMGNEYNWRTYAEYKMPQVYFIKNSGYRFEYEFDENKKRRNSFLYLGSSGQVHKGLDLLLEIFSEPGFPCDLYVCGAAKNEPDFYDAYYKELHDTNNIHFEGFTDIMGERFAELSEICSYSIMPSCSEGLSGAVLTSMSVGLVCICSRECGLEDDEVIHLKDTNIITIRKYILEYSQRDLGWISKESRREYDIVNERYSRDSFRNSFDYAIDAVLKFKPNNKPEVIK